MKPVMKTKIAVDICMTAVLLLLMAYSLVGDMLHEWLGTGMFVLFVIHHILNSRWWSHIVKGRYTKFRILQVAIVIAVLLSMAGSMASGVVLSRYVFAFLPVQGGMSLARNLHMVCAYWGFILMSLHLGIHWSMMVGMVKKFIKKENKPFTWTLRIIAVLIAGYGIYAFIKREILSYMLMEKQFVFFNFEEPLLLFILDYMAVMGLFVFAGHYISMALKNSVAIQGRGNN